MTNSNFKICVIGGGISGLTTAFLLLKKDFNVTLFEKSSRAGGNIESLNIDGYLVEYAPNSLLSSPRLVDLIGALGLRDEVLAANRRNKKRYVLQNGNLKSLPMSVAKMATDNFLSWKGKLRLMKEPFIRSKSTEDESVAAFFERRLGPEIVEKAVDPFISGIYAGNPEHLSIRSSFPRLYNSERDYGSLLVGSLLSTAEQPDKDFPRTFSFRDGVQTLTDKLIESLGECIHKKTEVLKIGSAAAGRWLVETEKDRAEFDVVVVSTPANGTAKLIGVSDADLGHKLENIYYPPVAMVYFGVKDTSISTDLDGFGFLVPNSEQRKILGTIWNSSVFSDRAPNGYHLMTTFVGGSRNAGIFESSDEEIFEVVYSELKQILRLDQPPSFRHIKRWPRAIPQYEQGYAKVENAIERFEAENNGIIFCSNFYKGISVGDCVKNSYKTAGKIERISPARTI